MKIRIQEIVSFIRQNERFAMMEEKPFLFNLFPYKLLYPGGFRQISLLAKSY